MQLHAAVQALQGLSAEAAELQARLAELATPQAAPLHEAAASTLEHLARHPAAPSHACQAQHSGVGL